MKSLYQYLRESSADVTTDILEQKGLPIDDTWLNNNSPVMTQDGRPAIVVKRDFSVVPNVIYGKVVQNDKTFDYQWHDDGTCIKAIDRYGNPKKPDDNDKLVKQS